MRRKPTVLKLLEGRKPTNTQEPQPKAGAPRCPSWLDDTAKVEWRRVVPELRRMGLLTVVDQADLVCYAQAWSDLKQAVVTIRKEGRTLTTSNGNVIQHPAVGQRNKAMVMIKAFAAEFGFSPASRIGIKVPVSEKKKSTWDGLLA
jgi:P27 family predicted phage terminase small subunit